MATSRSIKLSMSTKTDKKKNQYDKKKKSILWNRFKRILKNNYIVRIIIKLSAILIFFIGLYLVIYPFLPAIYYHSLYKGKEVYPYNTLLEEEITKENEDMEKKKEITFEHRDIPSGDRIVIPKIKVDMPIVQGVDSTALDVGIWHRPNTGIPGDGNMVLTGHRIGYAFLPEDIRNSTSFYNLDKLEYGDIIIIYWHGTEFDYQVYDSRIVEPTEVSIEGQSGDERLTLYTCHPLGMRSHRLVYFAKRV